MEIKIKKRNVMLSQPALSGVEAKHLDKNNQ